MHLVGFTMEIYYDARPYERQIHLSLRIMSFLVQKFRMGSITNSSRPQLVLELRRNILT